MKKIYELSNKKRIYIYGNGRMAQAFIIFLKHQYPDFDKWVNGCVVTSNVGRIKEFEGLHVYSIDEIMENDRDFLIYIAVREKYYKEISNTIDKFGFKQYEYVNPVILKDELEQLWIENTNNSKMFLDSIDINTFPIEEYLMFLALQVDKSCIDFEINLVDECNLNCQSCNHFSPIAPPHHIALEDMVSDLYRMNELFGGRIRNVMLLGGEPLLHPNIAELLVAARKCLPKAHLQLYTNGLLLMKMVDEFWKVCRENNIEIMITKYPVQFDYEQCFRVAKKNNVQLGCNWESFEKVKTTYKLPLHENPGLDSKKYENFVLCDHANRCVVVRSGRIYTCPFAAYIDFLNRKFNKNFPELEQNSISIYNSNEEEICDFLGNVIPLCSYCDVAAYQWELPWKTSKKELKEWVE